MSADTFIKKMLSMGYIENCRESSDTQEYYRFEHPDYLAHNEVDVVYTIYKGVDFSTQLENFLEYRGYSNNPGIFAQGDNWFKYEDPDDELASFIVCIDNTELYITIDDADLDYAYEILEGLGY